jgi:hypothetical protein
VFALMSPRRIGITCKANKKWLATRQRSTARNVESGAFADFENPGRLPATITAKVRR